MLKSPVKSFTATASISRTLQIRGKYFTRMQRQCGEEKILLYFFKRKQSFILKESNVFFIHERWYLRKTGVYHEDSSEAFDL